MGTERSTVFLLWHSYEIEPGHDEDKLCGVYSTRERAESARVELTRQPGFRERPDDFVIDAYELDEVQWTEGFGWT